MFKKKEKLRLGYASETLNQLRLWYQFINEGLTHADFKESEAQMLDVLLMDIRGAVKRIVHDLRFTK